ncbi:MAG TPA: tannase/feruloyl esterase family alpha/beta hydrolase [Vicinamibacterales bacterium]|nr:tannase/feruloyl esterase family alpha/beta hydrolase [Vicinamibacterales bacterium]
MRRVLAASALATIPMLFEAATAAAPPSGGTACTSLAALTIPGVTVRDATSIQAGGFTPPGSRTEIAVPAFCRVEAVARPTSDSEIKFEVWIPPVDAWNGKFAGVGNGGYMGSISYGAMATELRKGYATASTDTGHTGDDMRFGQSHPEKIVDYAYRAVHVMTDAAKLIVRDAQGRFSERAYFVGCSAGGQQALSEAQRFPDDYDGIVAGDPANNRIRQSFGFLYAWQVTHTADGTPIIPPAKLQLLTKAAVDACDALDGLKDGLIDDPRKCHFDPGKLICKGEPSEGSGQAECLTQPQVEAARRMYDGLKSPRTSEQIYAGWPRGSEAFGDAPIQSWGTYVTDPKEPMRLGFFKYFLFHDPNWDYHTIDWDRDLAYAEQKLGFFAPVEKDLSALKKRGGKLLMYTGWMDPVVPPQDTVSYYDGVVKTMGGLDRTKDFFRFFAAPGMGHCGGGPGPNTFDALGAVEQWVEHGTAPDRLVASHATNGKIDRTRPLCPFPQVARYKGTGSIDDAASFVCAAPTTIAAPTKTTATRGTR